MKNVAILGASGFVGQEIIKICLNHPHVKIVALSANKSAGETVQIHDCWYTNTTQIQKL